MPSPATTTTERGKTSMPEPNVLTPPDLDGFATFLGVRIAVVGEDGDYLVALGHHESLLRTLAAFGRCYRHCGEQYGLCPSYGRRATVAHLVEEHLRICWAEVDLRRNEYDWWLSWHDEPARDRFPVTVLDNLAVCGAEPMPERVQLRRTAGWRKPPFAVVVSRPSKWGNPYKVARCGQQWGVYDRDLPGAAPIQVHPDRASAVLAAIERYRVAIDRGQGNVPWPSEIRLALRGQDLACWCAPGQPCHADVLLALANQGGGQEK